MTAVKIDKFGGMLPAWDDRLLPDGQGSVARDAYLYSGALIGWRKPKLLHTLANPAATAAYRVPTTAQATADVNVVFPANVSEGDSIKIGEETYKFTGTVTNPYDVKLGANATASATNLFKALTLTGTVGTEYAAGTVANPAISSVVDANTQSTFDFGPGAIPWLHLVAPDFGTAYNQTAAVESTLGTRTRLLSSPLSGPASLNQLTLTFQGGTNQTADLSITGTSTWLEFVDHETDVLHTPVVDDQFNRYYFASPSLPPQYNTSARIRDGKPPWFLGVPAPGCAPGVDVSAGGNASVIGASTTTAPAANVPPANSLFLVPITPDGSMQVNDVSIMPLDTSASARFIGVIFSDQGGQPYELVGQGVQVIGCTTGVQIVSQFIVPPGLLSAQKYWIGFIVDTAVTMVTADASNTGVIANNTFSNGPPAFAPAMTQAQPTWQLWADVTSSAILETRAYLYTWVTEYGEEGPPSPPTLQTAWTNSIWSLTLWTPPADEMGTTRNIKTLNIYRAVTSTTGQATYFFVASVAVGTLTYVDKITDDLVALNAELLSTLWSPPPEGLLGIVSLPNGAFAGFKGNEIWFTEPYRPHAWPPNYTLTTEYPIVGLGVSGQAVVACTEGNPYVAIGASPGSMALMKVALAEPCLSRGSIVSTTAGVLYVSINGLIIVDQYGQGNNSTEGWVTREKWRKLTPDRNVHAVRHASAYFAFGVVEGADNGVAQQGFTVELASSDSQSFTIWPQAGGHRLGFGTLTAPDAKDIYNVALDPWTGTTLLIYNGGVYYYDFGDAAPVIMPCVWRSKKYQGEAKKNYQALRVWFDVPPGTPARPVQRDTDVAQALGPNQYGIVRAYCDGVLRMARELRYSSELMRMPSGFKGETWQFEIEGRVSVTNIQVATTIRELKKV